ncbi:hypothetical protein HYW20_02120 [Candidatus Woesearchaeota archaeon]|nr:hypothetical protein [Candidatus Woesearchaeota archaeon]
MSEIKKYGYLAASEKGFSSGLIKSGRGMLELLADVGMNGIPNRLPPPYFLGIIRDDGQGICYYSAQTVAAQKKINIEDAFPEIRISGDSGFTTIAHIIGHSLDM